MDTLIHYKLTLFHVWLHLPSFLLLMFLFRLCYNASTVSPNDETIQSNCTAESGIMLFCTSRWWKSFCNTWYIGLVAFCYLWCYFKTVKSSLAEKSVTFFHGATIFASASGFIHHDAQTVFHFAKGSFKPFVNRWTSWFNFLWACREIEKTEVLSARMLF